MRTTKQLSDDRAIILNKIPLLKNNSVVAVNTQWSTDGDTWAELYSRKTRKRLRINTRKLFLVHVKDEDKQTALIPLINQVI